MVPPQFLPLKRKGGFQREISEQCLTKEQTKQIYNIIILHAVHMHLNCQGHRSDNVNLLVES